jgi:signal transduction histidine kinase/CheY-like chemotaxis protein
MRQLLAVVGVLLVLGLLTWLLLRSTDTNARLYADALQALDDFALAEASLRRDVLEARAGLLRDYDGLGESEQAMEDAIARLRSYTQTHGLDAGPVERLAATVAQEEELTERFKSSNALLQNSLSYIGLLSTAPAFGATDGQLAPAPGALAAAILHLARDTSPDAANALERRIDHFASQAPTAGPDAEGAQALLAHARLLHGLLPEIDQTLKALVAVPSRQPLEATRTMFGDHQAAIEAAAQRFRLLLYLVSLLLLVGLVRLGLRLRGRALALRRRAAFERVIAENSTDLINCPPAETEARLKQVLSKLGRAFGAERAYVVLAETPVRVHAWYADGAQEALGWPDDALALFEQLGEVGRDIVVVRDVAALPPGEAKNKLAAVGARSWACVSLIRPGRVLGIMGFDKFQPAWGMVFPLPVVRLAGDAVASAIERAFLERDRAKLTTRLERARRMQTIGLLASGIAHNFNNIIGAILGYSEMVEPQLAPGTRPAQHIDEIRRAAERGRDLIDNILTFGRRREARIQSVQVRTLFAEAAALLQASLPTGIDLVVEDVPADIAVCGELAQLQQVILNLSTNAAQSIDYNGCVRVTAKQKDVQAVYPLSHGELTPGGYVCLAVTDTGRGFDDETARRLFEPFFTTRATGTGLGLATVHEIVRDHDGAMNVQSKPGQGSRFEAWLPMAPVDSTEVTAPASRPLGRGETVMIVESERERLLSDEEMLAALGYEPVGFQRSADAITACRSAPDRFDVIIVCHTARTEGGLDEARALHQIAPNRPLLLVAASAMDVGVETLAAAGISEVLSRPLVGAELAAALRRCLRLSNMLQA